MVEEQHTVSTTRYSEHPATRDTVITVRRTAKIQQHIAEKLDEVAKAYTEKVPAETPPAELASVNYTWGRVVGRLKKHVETGNVVPFFP